MKLGILGGTFNPIHYGHLRAAEEVGEMLSLDKVLFIPSGKPPFKKPWLINARHRYEMTRIAIKNNPLFEISDIEIRTSAISYSVETLKKLVEKYKDSEFFFILGVDAFLDFHKWEQPHRLMALTNLVIISRPHFSFSNLSSSPYIGKAYKTALKELDSGTKTEYSFPLETGRKVFLCKVRWLDISASSIRGLVKTGRTIKYLLPDSVESYIISHKLYKKLKVKTTN